MTKVFIEVPKLCSILTDSPSRAAYRKEAFFQGGDFVTAQAEKGREPQFLTSQKSKYLLWNKLKSTPSLPLQLFKTLLQKPFFVFNSLLFSSTSPQVRTQTAVTVYPLSWRKKIKEEDLLAIAKLYFFWKHWLDAAPYLSCMQNYIQYHSYSQYLRNYTRHKYL